MGEPYDTTPPPVGRDMSEDTIARSLRAVEAAAAEVYHPEGVRIWLDAPNPSLHNATPRQYVEAGDGAKVIALLGGLADGVMG